MNEVMVYQGPQPPMTVADVKGQVNLIQHIMKEVMKEGDHFGSIPGCGPKPALLKSGAEKLAMVFKFAIDPEVEVVDLGHYHREYRVRVSITTQAGESLGAGVGCCSTMEGKFRFRTGPTVVSDQVVPKSYWDKKREDPAAAQKIIGGAGFTTKKGENGIWYIATQGEKCEHDNPADYWNTVLKMAKKRAMVDAILTVTAASDIFTQDIEDDPSLYAKTVHTVTPEPYQEPAPKAEPKKETKKAEPVKKETPPPVQDPKEDDIPDFAKPEAKAEEKPKTIVLASEDQIQAFWQIIEALSNEIGMSAQETVTEITKGAIDPLAVTEAPANFILAATKKAKDHLLQIQGGQ